MCLRGLNITHLNNNCLRQDLTKFHHCALFLRLEDNLIFMALR